MKSRTFGILVGIIIVIFLHESEGFRCYICSGSDSAGCNDPFDKTNNNVTTTTGCKQCSKTKVKGVVTRACSPLRIAGDKCTSKGNDYVCLCSSNLCNTATSLKIPTVSMATATFGFLMYWMRM